MQHANQIEYHTDKIAECTADCSSDQSRTLVAKRDYFYMKAHTVRKTVGLNSDLNI